MAAECFVYSKKHQQIIGAGRAELDRPAVFLITGNLLRLVKLECVDDDRTVLYATVIGTFIGRSRLEDMTEAELAAEKELACIHRDEPRLFTLGRGDDQISLLIRGGDTLDVEFN